MRPPGAVAGALLFVSERRYGSSIEGRAGGRPAGGSRHSNSTARERSCFSALASSSSDRSDCSRKGAAHALDEPPAIWSSEPGFALSWTLLCDMWSFTIFVCRDI